MKNIFASGYRIETQENKKSKDDVFCSYPAFEQQIPFMKNRKEHLILGPEMTELREIFLGGKMPSPEEAPGK